MPLLFGELNRDQLTGLANLCFDIAKGAFLTVFIPPISMPENLSFIFNSFISLLAGLAFTYVALILLKLKGNIEQ